MIPDLAVLRDRAKETWRKYLYGVFAMGWRNANNHWRNFEMAYLLLAGLSTPLVLSVHTIVSFDFAVANLPGWHTTIFPPYFVAGAIFSGFGMVLTLLLPLRAIFGLHDLITQKHIDNMCKIILATGSMVGYAYSMEVLYCLVRSQFIRRICIYKPCFWKLLVGILDNDILQCNMSTVVLV